MINDFLHLLDKNKYKFIISIFSVYIVLIISLFFIYFEEHLDFNISEEINNFIILSLPVFIGMVIFPLLISRIVGIKLNKFSFINISKITIILLLIACLVTVFKFENDSVGMDIILNTCIIAFSEEYLFRYFLLNNSGSNKKERRLMLLLSSLIFAFIVHNNEPLLNNLLIRFPMGITLGYIYTKTEKIDYSILIHYIYNILLT